MVSPEVREIAETALFTVALFAAFLVIHQLRRPISRRPDPSGRKQDLNSDPNLQRWSRIAEAVETPLLIIAIIAAFLLIYRVVRQPW